MVLSEKKVLVGITGGISAYKALSFIRLLKQAGAEVQVILTESAKAFVTPLSIEALIGNKVRDSLFDSDAELSMSHIELSKWAEYFIIIPATANTITKLSVGMADDLLTTVFLATNAKKIIAPAMNKNMYDNKLIQENIKKLTSLGICFIGPTYGEQACGDVGYGRLVEPQVLFETFSNYVKNPNDSSCKKEINNRIPVEYDASEFLSLTNLDNQFSLNLEEYRELFVGKKVLITAGPTRELIDPVRYITNHSSGRMGICLALVAEYLGADVTLVLGHVKFKIDDRNIRIIMVETAVQMYSTVMESLDDVEVFVGCAAVADFRVKDVSHTKIKKNPNSEEYSLSLIKNPDILYGVANSAKKRPVLVSGFAAETDNVEVNALNKLKSKNCDLLFMNDVSKLYQGFNSKTNHIISYSEDAVEDLGFHSKEILAQKIFIKISEKLKKIYLNKQEN